MPAALPPGKRSSDELGTPLADVTFVVVDLETTGGSPRTCEVTEVGAVKVRGGECLGTFQTLVNPGVPIPPLITVLTGITEAMVLPAPPISEVLPALLEFIGAAVLIGHNVRFDVAFLDAALVERGYPRLAHRRVDTLGLARRLVRDEVPNLRLGTLARHLRAPTTPIHRALEDARSTGEVFHALLERAGTLGVLGLDDLLALPTIRAHPSASKLKLTARLPRRPGVYLFRDRAGRVLYVGKATNLRSRVRSYFGGHDRRTVPQLLRETESIEHLECAHPLEAAVRELRLVHMHAPRFNRQAKAWRSYAYLKLTLGERFPRLAVVRTARPDGGVYLGPLPSSGAAHRVREAVEAALAVTETSDAGGGSSLSEERDAAIVDVAARALRGGPELVLRPLEHRMRALVESERFEEAALTRDRLGAVAAAFERQRLLDGVRAAGRLLLDGPEGTIEIVDGRLVLEEYACDDEREGLAERMLVARWLERRGCLAASLSPPQSYEPPRPAFVRPGR